ncbi:DHH family phosphoesterase [Candidatus Falkowbacteria bacterium]|nr:DHH family phosphoesterase [Candidatus Falkowbacteria bacterium]
MSSIEKIWQVMPKINDEFIKKYPEYSPIVLQLLYNRDLTNEKDVEEFLKSPLSPFVKGGDYDYDPFLFNGMAATVELIIKHIKGRNKIVVYGDYDADGVTASAALFETLQILKADVGVYIPDRVSEGYGLNKKAIDEIISEKAKLIITVDGGIRGKSEVEYAKKKGLDVIITDHHQPPPDEEELPDCLIINPAVKSEKYPFKYLSGAGVAFKLAKALISKSTLSGEDKQKMEEKILDLAAIGTVADCVSLLGENRNLVKRGSGVLNKTKRKGLIELMKAAQLNNGRVLDAWNIGFQIAPRLNAAGRIDHANTALELLITKNDNEAVTLARDLNDKNIERQKITNEIVENIYRDVNGGGENKVIIAISPKDNLWNEGVIGLAAGRVCEKYYKPALVITRTEILNPPDPLLHKGGNMENPLSKRGQGGLLKGSGRSIDEFNIIKALEECAEFLDKFGGHPSACGFSLKEENLDEFVKKIKEVAERELAGVDLRPKIKIEAEISLGEINEELVKNIEMFAPFGEDNERPKFLSRGAEIVDIIKMGIEGQHIKLRIANRASQIASIISAVGFGQAEQWKDLRVGDKIDIVYYVEMNEFNGRREAQLKIIDIKKL